MKIVKEEEASPDERPPRTPQARRQQRGQPEKDKGLTSKDKDKEGRRQRGQLKNMQAD